MLAALDRFIARLETEIAAKTAAIEAAIAAKQIGDGNGYWKPRHALQCRLTAAVALRDALREPVE